MPSLSKGLRPLPDDHRDFHLGAIIELPALADLPATFSLGTPIIGDQLADGNQDFCSAYATNGMSSFQEGVELEPGFTFAAGKSLSGDPDAWGQDLRTAFAAHQKVGAIDKASYNSGVLEPQSRRRLTSYPQAVAAAASAHQKQSYFAVKGPYTPFDNIKATLYAYRAESRAVGFGIEFGWPLEQYLLDTLPKEGFGHAVYAFGWDETGLLIANSAGLSAGRNGVHSIAREVVNHFVPKYGAFLFVDMPKDQAQAAMQAWQKQQSPFIRLVTFMSFLWGDMMEALGR